jgi:SMC interacting uncharacterized protein involved in chromosome segregation
VKNSDVKAKSYTDAIAELQREISQKEANLQMIKNQMGALESSI